MMLRPFVLVIFSIMPCFLGAQDQSSQSSAVANGRIELHGHIPANCSVTIDGSDSAKWTLTDADSTRIFSLNSSCNRTGAHKLQIEYDKRLTRPDGADVVPVTIQHNGVEILSGAEIFSTKQNNESTLQVNFHPTPQTPKGTYTGKVTVTLIDA